jgi:1-pyrroline-5-carboxylate dehydrogenase
MGDPADFRNFMGAVIDAKSYRNILDYVEHARASSDAEIVFGGEGNDELGWFVEPTVVLTSNPHHKLMREEIFGPVLTVHVYDDQRLDETLEACDRGTPYALTGAVFAQDRAAIVRMAKRLRHAAGNFYVNDKPTGAVVGQQPFGGGRASGTNDKAGSALNLQRWVSMRAVKETFAPPTDFRYPYMEDEGTGP